MSWISDVREGLAGLPPDNRSLRGYGITMATVVGGLGIASLFIGKHHWRGAALLAVGIAFLVAAVARPQSLSAVRRAWMALALGIGWWVSRLLLLLSFVLLATPLGVVMRLTGRDPMMRKWDKDAPTYWIPRRSEPPEAASYEKPY